MKKINVLGNNVILKGETEKTIIIIEDKKNDSKKLKKLTVFSIGNEVKNVKEGQEVRVNPRLFSEIDRSINPFEKEYTSETDFYIVVKESEIIGYF